MNILFGYAYSDGMRVIESGKLSKQTPESDGSLYTELDRPNGQPCLDTKEFDLLSNMMQAVYEERYDEAAEYRDMLSYFQAKRKLRKYK
ncbi:bifunctional nuclease 2-like [Raphanus sativus]|uniref:Bifunctional nuclease 2-like n=1 Tax=Raphanus sativus TaxID=3726 RepID=A0A6J0KK56_RAPSA|nr:bifunctional nuclease 2-like [Raphanus sativus]